MSGFQAFTVSDLLQHAPPDPKAQQESRSYDRKPQVGDPVGLSMILRDVTDPTICQPHSSQVTDLVGDVPRCRTSAFLLRRRGNGSSPFWSMISSGASIFLFVVVVVVLLLAATAPAALSMHDPTGPDRHATDDNSTSTTVTTKTKTSIVDDMNKHLLPRNSYSTSSPAAASPNVAKAAPRRAQQQQPQPQPRTQQVTSTGSFQWLETVPHDTSAFTEGLQLDPRNGSSLYYESTGLYGYSQVRIVHLYTGQVVQKRKLNAKFFGEGLTYYVPLRGGRNLIQITWKERTGFRYRASDLALLGNFSFSTTTNEGWGITYRRSPQVAFSTMATTMPATQAIPAGGPSTTSSSSTTHKATSTTVISTGGQFVVSDGSQYLHFWDTNSFAPVRRRQPVYIRSKTGNSANLSSTTALTMLNELEWDPFTDTIYANIWQTNTIVRIDPKSGLVLTQYDLTNLYTNRSATADVLNGIAATDTPNVVWVTGKLWPYMFRIRLLD